YVITSKSTLITEQNTNTQIAHLHSLPFQSANQFKIKIVPNPAKRATDFYYSVPTNSVVSIKFYNLNGNLIQTIKNDYLPAGNYCNKLATESLLKGIYFIKYDDGYNQKTVKLIVQ
ncbi:MAG: T9SS type A sorting domain-containing protein, partial [candidate division WOR-3 bacterium]|nr:T9SS type A sorting domain-containing protein [candidate division WOR-3 bacterium]